MTWIFTDEMRFYLHEGETLLEGMIRTEHQDVRHMCRQGFCGACKMRVLATTSAPKFKQIPLAHLEESHVLACCCVPTGAMVVSYHDDEPKSDVKHSHHGHDGSGRHLQKTSIITRQIFYKIEG